MKRENVKTLGQYNVPAAAAAPAAAAVPNRSTIYKALLARLGLSDLTWAITVELAMDKGSSIETVNLSRPVKLGDDLSSSHQLICQLLLDANGTLSLGELCKQYNSEGGYNSELSSFQTAVANAISKFEKLRHTLNWLSKLASAKTVSQTHVFFNPLPKLVGSKRGKKKVDKLSNKNASEISDILQNLLDNI